MQWNALSNVLTSHSVPTTQQFCQYPAVSSTLCNAPSVRQFSKQCCQHPLTPPCIFTCPQHSVKSTASCNFPNTLQFSKIMRCPQHYVMPLQCFQHPAMHLAPYIALSIVLIQLTRFSPAVLRMPTIRTASGGTGWLLKVGSRTGLGGGVS